MFCYCLQERERGITFSVAIVGRAITIEEAIQKISHIQIWKDITNEAKRLKATTNEANRWEAKL